MHLHQKPVVLYIHGYESSPTPIKTSALADLGCTVIAPMIHYKENKGTYQRLKSLIEYYGVNWIVGSSLGGYTAFWLSQEYDIPTLLFNPALPFRKIDPGLVDQPHPIVNHKHLIFLGMQDQTVDPITTKKWIASNISGDGIKYIEHPENGHQISIDVFREVIEKASIEFNIFQTAEIYQ